VRRALAVPWDVAPKSRRTAKAPAKWIRWDSPKLLPVLEQKLGDLAATWAMAVVGAPQRQDADRILAIARILSATREAMSDVDGLSALEELAGVAGKYLRRHRRDVVGARADQVKELAEHMNRYVARGIPADQMADGFLRFLTMLGTPLQREFAVLGIRVELSGRGGLDPNVLKRVRRAFEKELQAGRKPGHDTGRRIVEKGLMQLGYSAARHVYSFEDKKTKRSTAE
jgi:hypothetical protein